MISRVHVCERGLALVHKYKYFSISCLKTMLVNQGIIHTVWEDDFVRCIGEQTNYQTIEILRAMRAGA